MHLQGAALPSDYDKAIYLSSYLKDGNPQAWLTGIEKNRRHLMHNWDALLKEFERHHGDSNRYLTVSESMEKLEQTGSCASFSSRFRELLEDLPTDFDNFVDLCIKLDNRAHKRQLERKKESSLCSNNSSSSFSRSSAPRNDPMPRSTPSVSRSRA